MLKTIYVVTAGEYSDYSILTVFDNEADAQAFVKRYNEGNTYDEARIEEYELNAVSSQIRKQRYAYDVAMWKDGDSDAEWKYDYIGDGEQFVREDTRMVADYSNAEYEKQLRMSCTVWATSQEHAVKIVNERRLQLIAMGQWKADED